jgi:spermidine synthase
MKPNVTLAEMNTPNGARLTLVEHDGDFCIRVNGQQLMHSAVNASELQLGVLACERHAGKRGLRVLIGGLGLGFTLKSVVQSAGRNDTIHVAELFPEIVAWNRTYLAGLNGKLLEDPRVKILEEDVKSVIQRSARAPYDVIALDIDNGTTAMVMTENNSLYSQRGMDAIALALKSDGRATVWSACPDLTIERRLKLAGFTVQAVPARLYPTAKRSAYMIYVADKSSATSKNLSKR